MSTVTNVILSFGGIEDDDVVKRLNSDLWLADRYSFGNAAFLDGAACCGGRKTLERPTYLGAFNLLNEELLLSVLREQQWRQPEFVQVFVCRQQEDLYSALKVWPK